MFNCSPIVDFKIMPGYNLPEMKDFGRDLSFSPAVHELVTLANQESAKLSHPFIGSEHLLMGFLRHPLSQEILKNAGLKYGVVFSVARNTNQGREYHLPLNSREPSQRVRNIFRMAQVFTLARHTGEIKLADVLGAFIEEGQGIGSMAAWTSGASLDKLSEDGVVEKIRQLEEQTPSLYSD